MAYGEEHVQHNEERYRVLIEQASDGIFLTDVQGCFVDVNPAVCSLSGYTREELLTKNIADLTREEDREGLFRGRDALLAGETIRSQWLMKRKGGRLIRTELTAKQLSNGYLQGFVHDISERVEAEKERARLLAREQAARAEAEDLVRQLEAEKRALQVSERKYRGLLDSNIIGVHIGDRNGKIHEANECLAKMFGYSKEELLSGEVLWYQFLPPGYSSKHDLIAQSLNSSGVIHLVEKEHIRKDGSRFPTLTAGAELDQEQGLVIMVFLDISDRKEAERRKQEFLGMVSHELRTPLTAIVGYLELAQFSLQQLPKDYASEVDAVLNRIEIMLDRASHQASIESRLVDDLLEVSRLETHKFELSLKVCNLATIVCEVTASQQPVVGKRRIEVILPPQEQVPVRVDAGRIGQVLINYLTNAFRYSPENLTVTVGLTVEDTMARVFVRDEGPGLTPSQQEHIWERFYQVERSLKQGGERGLGLGLYIAKIIVEQHSGQVGVESEPGRGSSFWFAVPLVGEGERIG
jgi:PAS domain S-box-containing protein